MRQWITRLSLLAVTLLCGCGGSGNTGLEGAWRGTLTWAEEQGTQSMFWSVYRNPASIGHSETVRWELSLATPEGCEVQLDFGLLAPEEDGSIVFPLQTVTGDRDCFPEVTSESLGSNRLQLAIAGDFLEETDAASGTATLRSVDGSGSVLTVFREGTWEATLDQ